MEKHHVIFQPSGRRGSVDRGKTLQDASRELGVDIESICGGNMTCGKCLVRIEEGFFERYGIESKMEHLSPVVEKEQKFFTRRGITGNYRMACVAEVYGDVLVFVPEASRAGKQIVRKSATERTIEVRPAIKKYYVDLTPASLDDPLGDYERLAADLAKKFGLNGLSMDYTVLLKLQRVIRQGGWGVTVTVWMNREIVNVEPGLVDKSYGLAVDVGTTTVAGYLCDLETGQVLATESMMNPQVPYGEDVMSRITYAQNNPDTGLATMNEAIIEGLNTIARNITAQVGLQPEDIIEMTLVGNTAMHHIFMNVWPEYLGKAPFAPALHHSCDVKARDMGIHVNPAANVHVLPIEAGFVGADNVGVLLAEEPYHQDDMALIIDIGTNGELVLGNKERLISSSCATGPALEGAHIKFGMRAAPGAIEKIHVDPTTYDVRYKVIGREEWSDEVEAGELQVKGLCGSGIIDVVAELFTAGIVKKNGTFVKELDTPRLRTMADGQREFVLAWADETSIGQDITFNQEDVRAVQLAKAAMYAGARIMMRKLGVTELDRVILAGAFGSYIDKDRALMIGLFPDCEPSRVYAVGNAAGDGARIALLNVDKREEANHYARQVHYVELTLEDDFEKQFMQAMHFPHMKDKMPHAKELIARERGEV